MEEELIAKNNNYEITENEDATSADISTGVSNGERPEMPENTSEAGGGPMSGSFPAEMMMAQNDANEWLAPMVGAGITSGVVIAAAVVIGWMIMRLEKRLKSLAQVNR